MKFEKLFYISVSFIVVTTVILLAYFLHVFNPPSGSGRVLKKIYFVDHISAAHQKVIDKFNEKYRGQIEVEAINLPFTKFSTNERKELLARYLRSKSDRIDIMSVDQIWIPRFAKWAVPLDRYIPASQKDILLKYAMESCYYNDSLVALPLYIDIAVMYYRKDLLKKLPDYEIIRNKLAESITWEDFISLKGKMGNNNPFFLFQADDFEGLNCIFAEMMANLNKPVLQNGQIQLNTPEAHKVLQMLVDVVNKYNMSPQIVTRLRENPSYNYFINNNGVFLRGWTAFTSKDSRNTFSNNAVFDQLEGIPPPHFSGFNPVSIYGGWNLMISKYSTKIPEALKFINFITTEEAQKILYQEGKLLPINTKIYKDSSYLKLNPELKFYYTLLQRGVHRPFTKKYTEISDIISFYVNLAISNKISVDEALSKATEKINSNSILIK